MKIYLPIALFALNSDVLWAFQSKAPSPRSSSLGTTSLHMSSLRDTKRMASRRRARTQGDSGMPGFPSTSSSYDQAYYPTSSNVRTTTRGESFSSMPEYPSASSRLATINQQGYPSSDVRTSIQGGSVSGMRDYPSTSSSRLSTTTNQGSYGYQQGQQTEKAYQARRFYETSTPTQIQGSSLKTWTFASPYVERVQVVLETQGRPLDASVELWTGPNHAPMKMRVSSEDGSTRPFKAVLETPNSPTTIAVRNVGQMEFPCTGCVVADTKEHGVAGPMIVPNSYNNMGVRPTKIQGGALESFPFDPLVSSIQVLLRTDGNPLNAKIELLQGPNNNKQVIELHSDDGMNRPFFAVFESPSYGGSVRVHNTATMEFPLTAYVEPYEIDNVQRSPRAMLGSGDDDFSVSSYRPEYYMSSDRSMSDRPSWYGY